MRENTRPERLEHLDFVKAICIFQVLMEHRDLHVVGPGAFLLPAFFLLSGYTFRPGDGGFRGYAVKRLRRLLAPFWLMMPLCALAEVLRASLFGYGDARVLIPSAIAAVYGSFRGFPCVGETGQHLLDIMSYKPQVPGMIDMLLPMNAFLWFLPAMFSANIVFWLVIRHRKPGLARDALTMLVLVLLAGVETLPGVIQLPYGLGRGFFGAALMLAGRMMREAGILDDGNAGKRNMILCLAVPISVLLMMSGYDCGGMVRSDYGPHAKIGVLASLASGLATSYVLICLCRGLGALPVRPVRRVLAAAGASSMIIYLWHMPLYFLGDLVMVLMFGARLTPDQFFMECFSGQMAAYRWFMVLLAFSLLTAAGWWKARRQP